jgi:hypothetical protein
MSNFFLFLFYEFVEIVECVSNGGKVEEVRDEFVVSSKEFEDLVAISVVFDIAPKFVGSKGDGLLSIVKLFGVGQSCEEVLELDHVSILLLNLHKLRSNPKYRHITD